MEQEVQEVEQPEEKSWFKKFLGNFGSFFVILWILNLFFNYSYIAVDPLGVLGWITGRAFGLGLILAAIVTFVTWLWNLIMK